MKKLIVLLTLLTTVCLAELNEYKVDLYYSTDPILFNDADHEEYIWREQVEILIRDFDPTIANKIGDKKVAYHVAEEFLSQMVAGLQGAEGFEAFVQWSGFKALIGNVVKAYINAGFFDSQLSFVKGFALTNLIGYGVELVGDSIITFIHMPIYVDQVIEFTSSIIDGRGVIVLSHGFGNVFTNKVYDELKQTGSGDSVGWMLEYFHGIGTGTLKRNDVNTQPELVFDNDSIMNESLTSLLGLEDYSPFFNVHKLINPNRHDMLLSNAVGEFLPYRDCVSIKYHKFEYYLGYPVNETTFVDENKLESKPRQTNIAKDLIQQYLHDEIMAHQSRESQWIYDTNSSDSKVFLKHKYDDSRVLFNLVGGMSEVYPFNMTEGKVYQLPDDGAKYVKALYGGKSIDANWTGQQLNELYRLNNPQEEKVLSDRFKFNTEQNLTIIDTQNYLLWDNSIHFDNWANANSYCQGLVSDSYDAWRMPTFGELKSILNPDSNIHIDEDFFTALATKPYGYWSSNTFTSYEMVWSYWLGWYLVEGKDSLVLNYKNASYILIDTKYNMNFMCVQQL